MIRIEHNLQTGEIKEIELTAKEIADKTTADQKHLAQIAAFNKKAEDKIAIADRLGLTADELAALLS
jgi:hypothetical protein